MGLGVKLSVVAVVGLLVIHAVVAFVPCDFSVRTTQSIKQSILPIRFDCRWHIDSLAVISRPWSTNRTPHQRLNACVMCYSLVIPWISISGPVTEASVCRYTSRTPTLTRSLDSLTQYHD